MAEADTPTKATSKLDSLPREDLVKFVKKQTVFLQKSKARCDELTKQLDALKSSSTANEGDSTKIKELQEELSSLRDEKEEMLAAYNAAQESQEKAAQQMTTMEEKLQNVYRRNKEMEEEIECLKLKDETLTSTMQCMQEERNEHIQQIQEWKEQVDLLTVARDEALRTLKTAKMAEAETGAALTAEKEDTNSLIESLKKQIEEQTEKESLLQTENARLGNEVRELESSSEVITKLTAELKTVRQQLDQISNENQSLKEESLKHETSGNACQSEISELKQAIDNLVVEKTTISEQVQVSENLCSTLKRDLEHSVEDKQKLSLLVHELEAELKDVQEKRSDAEDSLQSCESDMKSKDASHDILQKEVSERADAVEALEKKVAGYESNIEEFETLCKEYEQSNNGLRARISELEASNDQLDQRVKDSETENTSNEDVLAKLESTEILFENSKKEHNVLKEKHEELKEKLVSMKEENDRLKDAMKRSEEKMSEWESMIQMLKDDKEKTADELFGTEERELACRREIEELTSALHEALNDRDSLREEVCTLKTSVNPIVEESRKIKQALEELTEERDQLKDLKNRNSVRIEVLEKHFSESNQQGSELSELQQTVIELESKQAVLMIEKQSFEQQLENMRQEKEQMVDTLNDGKASSQNIEKSLQEIKTERDKLFSELEKQTELVSALKEEQIILVERFDACKADKESLVNKIEAIQTESHEHNNDMQSLESQLKDVSEKWTLECNEKCDLLRKCEELEEKLKQMNIDNQAENRSDLLRAEVESLKGQNKNLNDDKIQVQSLLEAEISRMSETEKMRVEAVQKLEDMSEKCASLETQVDELQEGLDDTQGQLKSLQKSEVSHLSLNNTLQADIEEIQTQLTEKARQIDEMQYSHRVDLDNSQSLVNEEMRKNEILQAQFEDVSSKLRESESRLERVKAEHQGTLDLLASVKEGQSTSSQEFTALQQELITLKTEKDELNQKHCDASAQYSRHEEELLNKIATAEDQLQSMNEENSSLKEKLNSVLDEKTCAIEEREKLKEILQTQLEVVSSKLRESESQLERVKAEHQGTVDLLASVKEGQSTSTQEFTALQQELITLKTEKDELNQKHCDASAQYSKHEEELLNKIATAEDQLQSMNEENSSLKEKLNSVLDEKTCAIEEREKLKESYEALNESFVQGKEQIAALELSIGKLTCEYNELKLTYDHSVGDNKEASGDLESLKRENEELMSGYTKACCERDAVQQQLSSVDEELANAREERDRLNERIQSATRSVEEESMKAKNLREECDKLVNEVEELRSHAKQAEETAKVEQEKTQQASVDSSRIKSLEKSLKESEEKSNKFRQLAIKGKKELTETKKKIEGLTDEVASLTQQNQKLANELSEITQNSTPAKEECEKITGEHQSLKEEYEKKQQVLAEKTSQLKAFEEDLTTSVSINAELKQQIAELKDEKQNLSKQIQLLENQIADLQKEVKNYQSQKEADRLQKEHFESESQKALTKVTEINSDMDKMKVKYDAEIKELEKKWRNACDELHSVKKDAKQSSVMDLEIVEYEKTVETLHQKIDEREAGITELKNEITQLNERVKALETDLDASEAQKVQAEERGTKLKQLLVKAKKELVESKKLEGQQRTSDAQLRGQLEGLVQQGEDYKIQIAELSGDKQKLQERSRTQLESMQRTIRGLESKVQSQQDDLDLSRSENLAVQAEYDSYKVRVHNVLKQQKNKSTNEVPQEQHKLEKERLEGAVEHLKTKLQELSEEHKMTQSEHDMLHDEHERLQARHAKLQQEFLEKEKQLKHRIETLSLENASANADHLENLRKLTKQNDSLSESFKDQIKMMQEDHTLVKNRLQKQLDAAESELFHLQRDLQHYQSQPQMAVNTALPQPKQDPKAEVADTSVDPRQEERQSGEGMEQPDTDSAQHGRPSNPTSTLVSFEKLLSSPAADLDKLSVRSFSSINEEDVLQSSLATAEKKVEHLTELVSESEGTVLHLTEQAKILKEEIRRLERNQKRENAISNMEYLKNIVLKFLLLEAGDERERLIPVLCTMLTLSGEEKNHLTAIARGEDSPSGSQANAAGWGSYLPRWSGLM